jgi:hypothetical protein
MTVLEQNSSLSVSLPTHHDAWLNQITGFEISGSFSTQMASPVFKNFLNTTDAFELTLLSASS